MAKKNIDLAVVLHDDCDYKDWLVELKERFYSHRLKASCATNGYLLDFYWKLGRDIEAKQYTNTYGSGFYKNLSQDLKNEMPGVKGFSPINLRYMSKFFKLYAPLYRNIPQTAELFSDSLSDSNVPQVAEQFEKRQQPVDDFNLLFSIPWDHHRRIIDKCNTVELYSQADTLYRYTYCLQNDSLYLNDINGKQYVNKINKVDDETIMFEGIADVKGIQIYHK